MIELMDVERTFGHPGHPQIVLSGVNMLFREGEAVAIVGESGAGKTTLCRILLRLLLPSAGSYTFDGRDVLRLRGEVLRLWRREIQAVFQNPFAALNPRVRVDVLVTEPLEAQASRALRNRTQIAAELLEMVGLPPALSTSYPHQLSGGQRQRVAIARALSARPRVLVLDEPLSALDVSVRAQILTLLRDMRRALNMTYVYITHDLATVRMLCDRAYVLYRGIIVEEVGLPRLVESPDNPYTQVLLHSVPSLERSILSEVVSAASFASRRVSKGCIFADRCPNAQQICFEATVKFERIDSGWRSRCHFAGQVKPSRPHERKDPRLI
jgi:oligopeptide/dipeptide ABC transporter ATP-binding protein